MSKYKIRIFSSFCPSENCKEIYERLCEAKNMVNYGEDKEIFITNGEDYTHVIILNTAMPILPSHIPKKNVIGFAFEPQKFLGLTPEFIQYAHKYIGKYYIGDAKGLGSPFTERYSHMWYNPPLHNKPVKTKLLSIMVSEKMGEIGHLYRHALVSKILDTNLPIDIYGRGSEYYQFMGDERIKGQFKEYEPYENYQFHIAIENMQMPHYFSEKIMNPLMCNTTPIYMGCSKIDLYFPNCVITLSGDVSTDFELFKNICENPKKYIKTIDVEKIKNIIYLLRNLDDIFR